MNKKIIVSDYDQTFYLSDDDIKLNNKMIERFRKKGNLFIIATGRSLVHFKQKQELYNIKYDYLILNHGAEIRDNKNNLLYFVTIKNNIVKEMLKDLELEEIENKFYFTIEKEIKEIKDQNLLKLNLKYKTYEDAINIKDIINKKYKDFVNCYYVNNNSIEIIANQANKGKAIDRVRNKLNINPKAVYVIGDGYSDIEMVSKFNGYCMKKSVFELKKVAKKEYSSVSNLVKDILNNEI